MSAKDAVAGLPGGQALYELADKVDGDPEAIRGIARKWKAAAGRCDESTTTVDKSVTALDGAWEGESADGFVAYMGRFRQAGAAVRTALDDGAGNLERAAEALQAAEIAVDNICERLLADVEKAKQQREDSSDQERENAIRQLVEQAVAEARPKVDEAEHALKGLAGRLSELGSGLSPKFSELPAPDTQPFTPAPGRQIEWSPVAQETSPTASMPGGGAGSGGPSIGGSAGGGGAGFSGGGGGFSGMPGGGEGDGLGASGGPPPGGGPAPEGQVAEWIQEAIEILKQMGYPVEKMNPNDIWMIIQHESGGNPHAINNWDSNAAAGTPSKGLMQTIDPTFNSYAIDGHRDIWNPVDNIIAGVRYAIDRYGSVSNVPGVVGMKTGTGYRGY
ncbi:hypothetical protein GCM10012275_17670 [Longimycelium tulufanense]|uniref:Transglycosylase SLT domain-containing protein n=1 Tax=Longimycelium tulufanense TaxID=907463 RepID=A0A8J3FTL3_9PSEU|nr:WXG100 family type VII secretion target [Longimycelium tulufanense]GGM47065.1 hypothetical protein GCM10012275_17670 [Longimycelium tulufanense]